MPVWIRLVFLAVFLPTFIGVNVFLYRRMVRDVTDRVWVRRLVALGMAGLLLMIPVMRFFMRQTPAPRSLALVVMGWWGFMIAAVGVLLLLEPLRRFRHRQLQREVPEGQPIDPAKRLLLARTTAATATALSASLVGYGMKRAFEKPEVTEVPVMLPGLPKALDGFTIVQLSDVHIGAIIQHEFIEQLVETANGAKPDLVAITGDLVDGTPDQLGGIVARLRNLRSRYGTHFVSGNHDWYSGWAEWAEVLKGMNMRVLRNERVVIGDDSASFDLLGVDDWHSRLTGDGYDLPAAAQGRDPSRASVLLAHQPQNFEGVNALGLGLQLSGHTHGGQLFPGTVIGDVLWGAQNAGLSKVGSLWQYTSRGCGFVGPPMRIGAPPEVVKLILTA